MRAKYQDKEYEISFQHLYKREAKDSLTGTVFYFTFTDPQGTTCTIKSGGEEVASATVWCHVADQFSRSEGRKRALTRAIKLFSRPLRTAIWEAYLARKPAPQIPASNFELIEEILCTLQDVADGDEIETVFELACKAGYWWHCGCDYINLAPYERCRSCGCKWPNEVKDEA